jgi:hypothetical protein
MLKGRQILLQSDSPLIPVDKILDTPNRKSVSLIVVVPVHSGVIIVEFTLPCVACIVLGRRPEVRVVTHIVEVTIVVVAVTAGKRSKADTEATTAGTLHITELIARV